MDNSSNSEFSEFIVDKYTEYGGIYSEFTSQCEECGAALDEYTESSICRECSGSYNELLW